MTSEMSSVARTVATVSFLVPATLAWMLFFTIFGQFAAMSAPVPNPTANTKDRFAFMWLGLLRVRSGELRWGCQTNHVEHPRRGRAGGSAQPAPELTAHNRADNAADRGPQNGDWDHCRADPGARAETSDTPSDSPCLA